ncbi:DUF5677 domain-containing protein [Streptomyces sp. NBC_01799]|nr:DUF5677 domain-containing protein [Streptomyces sp. NBC_01799]
MGTSDERDATHDAAPGGATEWASIAPDARLQPLFEIVGEVIAAAELAAEAATEKTENVHFDVYVLERGIKALKSARLLVGAGHWENASAVARQLFELLVNMEHLGSFADREKAQSLYSGFGFVQFFLAELRRMEFEKEHGRPPSSRWESAVREALDKFFNDFKLTPRADGSIRWRPSWSGKTTRALAELSLDPMREHQYELLFSAWSEQTHATPGVFATDLFDRYEVEVSAEALAKAEGVPPGRFPLLTGADRKAAQTLSMTITLFIQLWQQLPNVPQSSVEEINSRLGRVRMFMARKVFRPSLPIAE